MRSRVIVLTIILTAAATFAEDAATPTTRPVDGVTGDDGARSVTAPTPPRRLFQRLGERMRNGANGGPNGGGGGPSGGPNNGLGGGGFGGGPGGFDPSMMQPPTDEEWQKITQFSHDNFPNRWQMFERVQAARGSDSRLVQELKIRIAARYRTLMKAQTDMPSFYETAMSQGKQEDAAWGLALQVQRDPDNLELRNQLRESVASLIKGVLAERADRIKRARDAIDTEQAAYDRDSGAVDSLIDAKVNRLTADNADLDRNLDGGPPPATAPSTPAAK